MIWLKRINLATADVARRCTERLTTTASPSVLLAEENQIDLAKWKLKNGTLMIDYSGHRGYIYIYIKTTYKLSVSKARQEKLDWMEYELAGGSCEKCAEEHGV